MLPETSKMIFSCPILLGWFHTYLVDWCYRHQIHRDLDDCIFQMRWNDCGFLRCCDYLNDGYLKAFWPFCFDDVWKSLRKNQLDHFHYWTWIVMNFKFKKYLFSPLHHQIEIQVLSISMYSYDIECLLLRLLV